MSEKLVFWGSCRVMARAEEKSHRGTEVTEKGVSASVTSVPLWFKILQET